MNFQWLGLTDYYEALAQQEHALERASHFSFATVFGLEHPAVVTLGKRGEKSSDILATEKDLHDLFIQVVKSDRGGQATLHSPGQLVIYPVIPVKKWGIGVKDFVELLQSTTQEFLKSRNIDSVPAEGAGLQTKKGKIAFIGIRIQNGISKHGISINIHNDLSLFNMIRPCGYKALELDSISNYNQKITLKSAFTEWSQIFFNHTKEYHESGMNTAFLSLQ